MRVEGFKKIAGVCRVQLPQAMARVIDQTAVGDLGKPGDNIDPKFDVRRSFRLRQKRVEPLQRPVRNPVLPGLVQTNRIATDLKVNPHGLTSTFVFYEGGEAESAPPVLLVEFLQAALVRQRVPVVFDMPVNDMVQELKIACSWLSST